MAMIWVFLICLCLSRESESVWWTLGTHTSLSPDPAKKAALLCFSTPQLNTKQREMCRKHPTLMTSVAKGAKDAVEECQIQFERRRWNCSAVPESGTLFDPILKRASREAAYLHAITAAGVSHAVTASCGEGNLQSCDCDRSLSGTATQKGWTWSGCSSNVKFGTWFSEQFTDASTKGNSPRAVMNRHNSRAGRKALSRLLWRKCKCHGLSGSCTMKTCWMQQPTFHQVGDHLKKKYESASEMVVKLNRRGKERLRLRHNHLKRPSESDLMYYEPSPNYCDRDPSEGSLGTSGRECNISSSGIDGCELLCCGRGHNIQQVKVTRNCNCIFIWCCHVKCQKCKEIVNKYTCK
ncbi:protein Wnt-3a-like isoform X2 [Acropora millepora]|uniref:protein Wnt-3a-like isoform X2 n=1 Tax=Acropora millepora TaxID=45264 RepID=UPI001CF1F941|nr:protein Wnt-3a-like isoform X2 [Acropora millepora]